VIDALQLGATLYMPATRGDLATALFGGRIHGLRSAVICLEDAVLEAELPQALANLSVLLRDIPDAGPTLFVRPRDPAMLAHLLRLPGIERVHGFVLPKVTAETLPRYLGQPFAPAHRLMPTLETREAFDSFEVRRLREQLLAVQDRILAVRIGGNDLLQTLGVRRSSHRTSYDGPLGPVIATLAAGFLPYGFAVSAPVMDRFDDPVLLREEVLRDVEHGLLTKTAIHPAQIAVIHGALAVSSSDLLEAQEIVRDHAAAVFAAAGRLCEPATHRRWAETILRRAELFGVADPLPIARHG
jgi:citrate lyase beta subunit